MSQRQVGADLDEGIETEADIGDLTLFIEDMFLGTALSCLGLFAGLLAPSRVSGRLGPPFNSSLVNGWGIWLDRLLDLSLRMGPIFEVRRRFVVLPVLGVDGTRRAELSRPLGTCSLPSPLILSGSCSWLTLRSDKGAPLLTGETFSSSSARLPREVPLGFKKPGSRRLALGLLGPVVLD